MMPLYAKLTRGAKQKMLFLVNVKAGLGKPIFTYWTQKMDI
jgi:hypothetical protein